MTIGASLPYFAERKPDAPAIVCDEEIVTWRELFAAVEAMSITLDDRAPQQSTIALVLKNSPALLAFFLACARTGREAAILDAGWPAARIGDALRELSPALTYSHVPGGERANWIDPQAPLPGSEALPVARNPDPRSPFYVGFTSGSTGQPKGYRRTHDSWLASFDGDRAEFGMAAEDVVLAPGSMAHSLFLYAAIHALQIGATLLMARSFHPANALRMAQKHRATIAYAAPTQWRMLIDAATSPLPHLRWALSSGAKWFPQAGEAIRRLAPETQFAEFYGASELSFVAVRKSQEACPENSVGRAFANVRICIRDDDGRELGPGRAGHVFVASPYLFAGYVKDRGGIAMHGDEMSVGDIGFLDHSGFLHLVGRRDRMIVSSGKNVFPEEIERALVSIAGIRAAAVMGADDPLRGQRIEALLLADDQRVLRKSEIVRRLRENIPSAFLPRRFALAREWRWTASGKTDFEAMRRIWEDGDWDELK